MKKTTIYTLSMEAGVSPATVSKIINNSHEISGETRNRVLKLVEKNNFVPRQLRRHVANISILLQQYHSHPLDFSQFVSTVLEGMGEYIREEKLEMGLYARDVDDLNKGDLVRELRKRNIDGVVVLCANDQSRFYKDLKKEDYPYFSLYSDASDCSEKLLSIDNEDVGYKAVKHLIDFGHRKIGVILSPPLARVGRERLSGAFRALRESKLLANRYCVEHSDNSPLGFEGARLAVKRLLDRNPGLTGLFVMSHEAAIGAMRGIHESGRNIPDDISLVGCDNFHESGFLMPSLTTIDIPNRRFGYLAARQVHRLIRKLKPDYDNSLIHSCELIIRESTRNI